MAALSDSAYRTLEALAAGGECSTAEIAATLGVHQTTVSREMRTLVDRGLAEVSGRRANTFLYRAAEIASGPPKPYVASWCTCGDLSTVHVPNSKGMRARCAACDCRLFVKAAGR